MKSKECLRGKFYADFRVEGIFAVIHNLCVMVLEDLLV
jgi:hypothetical protein